MRRRILAFVLLGAAAFLLSTWLAPPPAPPTLAIDPAVAALLRRDWTARTGTPPSPAEWDRLAADALDEEALYRAAVAMGLDADDSVVQARVLRDMRFLDGGGSDSGALYGESARLGIAGGDLVVRRRLVERLRERLRGAGTAEEPSEAALHTYLESHRQDFRIPARVALAQVFLSRQRRGVAVAADASDLLLRLRPQDADRADGLGDPFPIALPGGALSEHDLARVFGQELASSAMALPSGRWSEPLASAYGLHLIWVRKHLPASDPPLGAVRARVRAAVREARAEAALRDGMSALRAAYGLVAPPAPGS